MDYKFGEYIRKRESDFLKTKVASDDLIRINDANTYLRDYLKQFDLHIVGKSFEILPSKVFCYYIRKNFFWFRIFGRGLDGENLKTEPLSFSERIGKRKSVQIFGWRLSYLKKK